MDDDQWPQLYETIEDDCIAYTMSSEDARIAWRLGLQAFTEARTQKASFPHDEHEC